MDEPESCASPIVARPEKTINQLARDSERQIAELLGERRFTQLRLTLEELASKLSEP